VRFLDVRLQWPAAKAEDLERFYGRQLGLERRGKGFVVGETVLEFVPAPGEPYYHFALLVPGDRFPEARAWAAVRAELLPHPVNPQTVFRFASWRASSCYLKDPAGNIVELIAHAGVGETGADGMFRPSELLGISELGIVGDLIEMAGVLERELDLHVWAGTLSDPDGLAFVGEKARTFILSSPRRCWAPTGRQAEPHPVEAVVSGPVSAAVQLEGSLYRISVRPATRVGAAAAT
jgi:hypothetical protein